jgi:O-methyltransferase involved in polyketide biosynthesis
MTNKILPKALSDVSETMLMTLYARALESRRPDALARDPRAEELVARIDYDFAHFQINADDQVVPSLRLQQLDRIVRAFMAAHPDSVVVHIGCGLDTRFDRVDNGQVLWYDLDLPPVIEMRRKLLAETPRYTMIASSALDLAWLDGVDVHPGKSFLFIAEGVLMYFPEAEVRRLVLALRERFAGAELAFDAAWPLLMWLYNLGFRLRHVDARLRWPLRPSYDALEAWAPGIQLLEAWNLTSLKEFPSRRKRLRAMVRLFPSLGKMGAVLHYRLGESSRTEPPSKGEKV